MADAVSLRCKDEGYVWSAETKQKFIIWLIDNVAVRLVIVRHASAGKYVPERIPASIA